MKSSIKNGFVFLLAAVLTSSLSLSQVFADFTSEPVNVQVTRYADSDQTTMKYATLTWDALPGAVSYNIYTVGSSDIFFDSSPTNAYTFKFNPTSSWYFKISAVDASGSESNKSSPLTIAFPSAGTSLETPKNLHISEVETTSDPSVRKVHIFWDAVPGTNSYIIYTNAGTTYYYKASVDTNLYEMDMNVHSIFYIAVSARKDNLESARSQVLTIDGAKLATPFPSATTTATNSPVPVATAIPTPTAHFTPQPTPTLPAASDDSINRLKKIEQDVKNLKSDVQVQQQQQQETQGLLSNIVAFLKKIFGFGR